ncbi:BURP domain-containing protein 3 [Bienertia sinuspersici]
MQEDISSIEDSIASLFFVEEDLSLGKKMSLYFRKSTNPANFLSRDMVEKLHFSLANLPQIIKHFNLREDSLEASIMKETLQYCEDEKSGDKCCYSLESMIDFATSIIGKQVMAISANINKDIKMEYKVQGIKKLPCGAESVICHKIPFPCAVFYCQKAENMDVFIATLVGSEGTTLNAPAVCRKNTNSGEPRKCPICHFLLDDDVLWIAK